jgi:hypothetical protein
MLAAAIAKEVAPHVMKLLTKVFGGLATLGEFQNEVLQRLEVIEKKLDIVIRLMTDWLPVIVDDSLTKFLSDLSEKDRLVLDANVADFYSKPSDVVFQRSALDSAKMLAGQGKALAARGAATTVAVIDIFAVVAATYSTVLRHDMKYKQGFKAISADYRSIFLVLLNGNAKFEGFKHLAEAADRRWERVQRVRANNQLNGEDFFFGSYHPSNVPATEAPASGFTGQAGKEFWCFTAWVKPSGAPWENWDANPWRVFVPSGQALKDVLAEAYPNRRMIEWRPFVEIDGNSNEAAIAWEEVKRDARQLFEDIQSLEAKRVGLHETVRSLGLAIKACDEYAKL